MKKTAFALAAASLVAACSSNKSQNPPTDDAGATADAGSLGDAGPRDGGGGALTWWSTCGDPVCPSPLDDAGPRDAGPPCPAIGSPCTAKGETCGTHDPQVNCGAIEECSDTNPAVACPISSRKYKDGITYVGGAELASLHDEALRTRLATYRYSGAVTDEPGARHLGFVIEDQPPRSPSIDPLHDRVDLYGFASMTLAAVQVQEKEIAALRRELDETRRACKMR